MIGFLGGAYLWVKAAHILFVVFWMAGLFMLPRYLAYHLETPAGTNEDRLWMKREAMILRIILNPAMVMVWALGLTLVIHLDVARDQWFIAKFGFVVLLTLYQAVMAGISRRMTRGWRGISGRTMRILNEVPALLAAVIIILVVVRPSF